MQIIKKLEDKGGFYDFSSQKIIKKAFLQAQKEVEEIEKQTQITVQKILSQSEGESASAYQRGFLAGQLEKEREFYEKKRFFLMQLTEKYEEYKSHINEIAWEIVKKVLQREPNVLDSCKRIMLDECVEKLNQSIEKFDI